MYLIPDSKNKVDSTVSEVQTKLNAIRMNFHHSWDYLNVDGIYGKNTASVVKKFQEYRGIVSSMTPTGPVLGDTTINYIRQEYERIPVITSLKSPSIPHIKRSDSVNKPQTAFDTITLLSNEGAPIYKKLEEAFPLAFKRLSARSDRPLFVFSKQEAYHQGAKYSRISIPENVARYLGTIGTIWSWISIYEDYKNYRDKIKNGGAAAATLKLGANIFSACTSSIDTVLSFPATKQLAAKIAGHYAVAETGAAISVAGASTLSTIGSCIGAFLLGWEIGKLIGDIPIGNGRHVQDIIDELIDKLWEHPYRTIGPSCLAIALAIDGWKKIIEFNVNRVSNLKPLSPEEKRKLDQYIMQHREMAIYATPPKYYIHAK